MATNNEDFEDDNEQNEQELEQTDDQDKRKRYFSKECKFWFNWPDLPVCVNHQYSSTN